MKILFWSEQEQSGVTSNMAAIAARLALKFQKKCVLLQTKRLVNDIGDPFMERQQRNVFQEECDYFLTEGLDYLMLQKELSADTVQAALQTLIPDRLFYMPAGKRELPGLKTAKTSSKFLQLLNRLEEVADVLFLDCGTGQNMFTKELMKVVDLVVVNFPQTPVPIDHFFLHTFETSKNFFYLISRYQAESIYNKQNLKRIYRIPQGRFGVIPYNPKFQNVCQRGQLERFVRNQNRLLPQERDQLFLEELDFVSGAILEAGAK